MADQFQTTETSGLLKNDYGDSPMSEALKRKRKALAESRLGLDDKGQEG